jgi:hypothetical protein
MTGLLATLAIAGAFALLGLIIAYFSRGRQKSAKELQDFEDLKRQLFKIEQDVRELRQTSETKKSESAHETVAHL